jgi:hypothetical protein
MKLIWRLRKPFSVPGSPAGTSPATSRPASPLSTAELNEKQLSDTDLPNTHLEQQVQGRRWWRRSVSHKKTEKEKQLGKMARSMKLYSPVYIGLAAGGAACEYY